MYQRTSQWRDSTKGMSLINTIESKKVLDFMHNRNLKVQLTEAVERVNCKVNSFKTTLFENAGT
jgi:hypothetical protein